VPSAAVSVLCVLAVFGVIAALGGCGLLGDGPQKAARDFAAAWSAADDARAGALTDDAAAATAALGAVRKALTPGALTVTVGAVRAAKERASAAVEMRWDLGEGRVWSYPGELELRPAPQAETGWVVHWAPRLVHPQLGQGQQLALRPELAPPAPILDRAGAPLMSAIDVVTVLLDRRAAGELAAVAGALARALAPVDATITERAVVDGAGRTPEGQAYSVAVLRASDYDRVRAAIHELPGVRFVRAQRLLARDAAFGRQVLSAVRTGQAATLAGTPGWAVVAVDAGGGVVRTLTEQAPVPGKAVGTTLDTAVQAAAEGAVDPLARQAMIVAIDPTSGGLLAVAQNDAADAQGSPALTGRYPPGSTFKIVTAVAGLAQGGLSPQSPVACPASVVIDGYTVPNKGLFDLGTVALQTAFARSCNTTFAQLAERLPADALPTAALTLGFGADFALPGPTTFTGVVPAETEPVPRAANGFGQGQVLASPFGMALIAATVARDAPVVPQLVAGLPTEVRRAATAPDPRVLDQLRTMMRAVVTEGTATRLAGLGEVRGKTGTAEYTADGRAHGWFVGQRGNLAFAVLVVDGGSSAVAVEVAQRFLAALP